MNRPDLKQQMLRNAETLRTLHDRIDETFKLRDRDEQHHLAWKQACETFHASYDRLAFPGGYDGALERIAAGDPAAMEAAICFLECRPYFFRSGYMFKDILKKAKRAPLGEDQASRLQTVLENLAEWRKNHPRS